MTGNPQVNLNEDTDRLSVLGRSASGAVVLWVINVANPNDPPSMRVLVTATQVRNLVLRNGMLTGLSVTFGDANGDESSDQILSLSFRNGLLRVFNIGEKGDPVDDGQTFFLQQSVCGRLAGSRECSDYRTRCRGFHDG
jgi:hypothetical protein